MKALIGLLLSILFVSAVYGITPIKLVPGQSYVYSYTGRLTSGIAQLDSNAAILEIMSDIVLQAERQDSHVAMQMMNIRVGKHNGPVSEQLFGHVVLDHQPQKQYEEELSKPIRFYWDNGQIKNFEADQSEPQWSINMKKSILSLFNINLTPKLVVSNEQSKVNDIFGYKNQRQSNNGKLVVYPVYEDGINGVCETLYQVISATDNKRTPSANQVFNITKTRNYANCLTQPTIERTNVDVRGAPVICHQGKSYPLIEGYYPMPDEDYQLGSCTSQEQNGFPVSLFNYVKYNISTLPSQNVAQIDSIYGQGKTVYETNGKQLLLISQQNVTLVDVIATFQLGPIRQIRNILLHQELSYRLPMSEAKLDIPYYHLYGQINKQELKDLILFLLDSVASDIEDTKSEPSQHTNQKIVQLANAMAVMDFELLDDIFEKVIKQYRSQWTSEHYQIVRKLLLDLISYAGTTDSALFVKRLYEQDRISTGEAKEMLETIPQNLFLVDGKVVEAYLNMFLSDKVQYQRNLASSLGIALGKLINQVTIKQQQTAGDIHDERSIRKQQQAQTELKRNAIVLNRIRRAVPWHQPFQQNLLDKSQVSQLMQLLRKALKISTTFHQKVTLIETLAHTGTSEALSILAPYVEDNVSNEEMTGYAVENEQEVGQERNFIRQVTIYALTHLSRTNGPQVSALLFPIFQNKYEPYEVRIAAFTVLLGCDPGKAILERIGSEMHQESNRQVRSFVVSALNTIASFSEPSTRKLAQDARFALGFTPKDDLGLLYSKMVGKSYYDEEKQYGLNLIAEWVANNISQIPRSGYLAIRENDGSLYNVLLEVGYNVKGLDNIIKQMVDSNELFIDALKSFSQSDKDRRYTKRATSSVQQTLEALKKKLNLTVRGEDEPKATIFFKLFERTSYYSFDSNFIQQLIDSAEYSIKDVISKLVAGQDYHYVKLAMPKQLYKVVSSEIGLPVIVTERHPTILSVRINQAKLQLNYGNTESDQSKSSLPEGADLILQIEPSLYHSTYHFVFAVEPVTTEAIGSHVEKSTRVTVPLDLSVGFWRPTQQLSWSITPRVPQEIYHHQTEAKTFIFKAKIARAPEGQWLSGSSIISQRVPFKYERQYFKKDLGIGLRLQMTSENENINRPWYMSKVAQKFGLLVALIELWNNDQMTPYNVSLTLDTDDEKPVTGYNMSISYKKLYVVNDYSNSDSIDEYSNGEYSDNNDDRQFLNRQQMLWYQTNLEKRQKNSKSSNFIKTMARDMVAKWNKQSADLSIDNEVDIIVHNIQVEANTQSDQPISYALKLLLAHTYDKKRYWATAQGASQASSSSSLDEQFCFESMMVYPNRYNDFYYRANEIQDLKALVKAKLDFGVDCQDGSHVELEAVMETGKEEVSSDLNIETNQQAKDWFYQQCNVDMENGQPAIYACQRALVEDSYFKKMTANIKYDNIPPKIVNWTNKLALASKMAFYTYMDENQVDVDNEANKLHITAQYLTRFSDEPMMNVYVQTPKENMFFKKIMTPYFRPPSALLTNVEVYKNLLTAYQGEDYCTMTEDYIRTLDNVTIKLQNSPCQYLLVKDCSSTERFAIFVRQLDTELKNKEVTVFIDGKEIVLSPSIDQSLVKIQIDGQVTELKSSKALVMSNGQMSIYIREASSMTSPAILVIQNDQHDLTVLYDGKNVKVKVGKRYRGETCGLCGDDNHESDNEFTGPDTCIYNEAQDFVNSYAVVDSNCLKVPVTQGVKACSKQETITKRYMAPKYESLSKLIGQWNSEKEMNRLSQIERQLSAKEITRANQQTLNHAIVRQQMNRIGSSGVQLSGGLNGQQKMLQRMRTMAIRHNDQFCFSVQPILSCIEGFSRPTRLRQQMLAFHCLPSQSISAQKLVEQSQYQALEIFGKKQVDLLAPFQIPVSCQSV